MQFNVNETMKLQDSKVLQVFQYTGHFH